MASAKKNEMKKASFFSRVDQYFKDVRAEARKVIWPAGKQLRNYTLVVLVMVLIFGIFIWAADGVMGFVTNLLLGS